MLPISLEELYKKHPELEDIAIRLELSKKAADDKNREKKDKHPKSNSDTLELTQPTRQRRIVSATAEHGVIEKFYKDGIWHNTHHLPQPGRQPFETNLERIYARRPDAIRILIYSSSKTVGATPSKIVVRFNTDIEVQDVKESDNSSETLNVIQTKLNGLEEEMKSKPAVKTDSVGESVIAQLNYAQQLTEIKHAHKLETLSRDHKYEIDRIQDAHQKEVAELNEEIEELQAEIEELEAELAETDASLNGIDEKIKDAENPNIARLLGKIVSNAAEHFVKENISGIAKFGGIDESELAGYFKEKDEKKNLPAKENTSEASFSAANDSVSETYNSLDPKKKELADNLIGLVSENTIDDLAKILYAVKQAFNEDGTINDVALKAMYAAAVSASQPQEQETN